MKLPDKQKHELIRLIPGEIPQASKLKIIEFIEKITDLFEEEYELSLELIYLFGIACAITSQIYQGIVSESMSDLKDVE